MLLLFLDLIDTPEDRSLFEELYYTYRQYMFKAAYSYLGDEGLAEDAVIEAFTRIAKNFETFRTRLISSSDIRKSDENTI